MTPKIFLKAAFKDGAKKKKEAFKVPDKHKRALLGKLFNHE